MHDFQVQSRTLVFQDKNHECSTCVDFGVLVALVTGEAYDGGVGVVPLLKVLIRQIDHITLGKTLSFGFRAGC
jgi:hypothetical protein